MTASILDGKLVASSVKNGLRKKTDSLKEKGIEPRLATILVGDDLASKSYLKSKHQACAEVGITSENHTLPAETSQEDLGHLIDSFNKNQNIHGILLQLPLPKHLDANKAIEMISPDKDVDGLTPSNMGLLVYGRSLLIPCTPRGVMAVLHYYNVDLKGRTAVIVNRSYLVGKPLAFLMLAEDATVTLCHSKSKDLERQMQTADILVVAVGKRPTFTVTAGDVKQGAVVVDVAINRVDGKICGDVDFESVSQKASWITPVPGGVGPMTVTMLLQNTLVATEMQTKQHVEAVAS